MDNQPYIAPLIGILGGGQLGRMLIQAGIDYNIRFAVLDPDANAPCRDLVEDFAIGSLLDYSTVVNFGRGKDIITIEIEAVNVDALKTLEKEGVAVYPQPHIIELIQDKRQQKQFYTAFNIPTARFVLIDSKQGALSFNSFFPSINKIGKGGYDGKGVIKIDTVDDLNNCFSEPSLMEVLVPFTKEIAIIAARNADGVITSFPVVEMIFHPEKNLVEYLKAPADVSPEIAEKAKAIAFAVVEKLGIIGILAVEMFVTQDGNVLVNEVAPRPHNSGHHTIEANFTSQFLLHLQAILGLPFGSTKATSKAAMLNILGEDGYQGIAKYQGFRELLSFHGVYPHLYGKLITKPFRKMGHITIIADTDTELDSKVAAVKSILKVTA